MVNAWMPIADGDAGISQILQHLQQLKYYYGGLPSIRAAALRIAGTDVDNDQVANVDRLADFVRRGIVYQTDPFNSELTQTPDVLLLEINRVGRTHGDCDDHVLLFASLCESLGIYCEIVAVQIPGTAFFNHVIAIAHPLEEALEVDLCAKEGVQPAYPEKLYP